ncbi:MAG: hypothetical protein AB1483_02905 [Candidatus Zixiibacteriota bacterium]
MAEVSKRKKHESEKKYNICDRKKREGFGDFLRKLLNNNLNDYFYLAEDPDLGLYEPHVAYLNLSVAIRAADHYDKCLGARFGQLTEIFRAKLGWLIGNAYSRVGTQDWTPEYISEKEFSKIIDEVMDSTCFWTTSDGRRYFEDRVREMKEQQGDDFSEPDEMKIKEILSEYADTQDNMRQRFADTVSKGIVAGFGNQLSSEQVGEIQKYLATSPDVDKFLRRP